MQKLCYSCGSPALCYVQRYGGVSVPEFGQCSWKCDTFQVMRMSDLVVGDIVRRFVDKRLEKPPAQVIEIEEHPRPEFWSHLSRRTVTIRIHGKRSYRDKRINNLLTSRVRILRPGVCGNLVCELHAREVSEEKFYCMDHWNSWREVAA